MYQNDFDIWLIKSLHQGHTTKCTHISQFYEYIFHLRVAWWLLLEIELRPSNFPGHTYYSVGYYDVQTLINLCNGIATSVSKYQT